jgi:hypothetical protein
MVWGAVTVLGALWRFWLLASLPKHHIWCKVHILFKFKCYFILCCHKWILGSHMYWFELRLFNNIQPSRKNLHVMLQFWLLIFFEWFISSLITSSGPNATKMCPHQTLNHESWRKQRGLSKSGLRASSPRAPKKPWNWQFLFKKNFDSKFGFKSIILVHMVLNF